jgi:hypothetical protein
MTLARMLRKSGCSVMVTCARNSLDTFIINHLRIALVLVSGRLSEAERIRIVESLSRIDARVPIIVTGPNAPPWPNNGERSWPPSPFAELVAEVRRRAQEAKAPASGLRHAVLRTAATPHREAIFFGGAPYNSSTYYSARDFSWPLDDVELNEIEWGQHVTDQADQNEAINEARQGAAVQGWEPLPVRRSIPLPSITSPDPRTYFAALNRARRARRRRIRRIGLVVAAGPLLVTTLLQMRTTTARAIAQDATVTQPLASASISARVGLVPLVSGARVNRSALAAQLGPALRAGSDALAE